MRPTCYVFAPAPRLGTVKRRPGPDRRFRAMIAVAPDRARGVWQRRLRDADTAAGLETLR